MNLELLLSTILGALEAEMHVDCAVLPPSALRVSLTWGKLGRGRTIAPSVLYQLSKQLDDGSVISPPPKIPHYFESTVEYYR